MTKQKGHCGMRMRHGSMATSIMVAIQKAAYDYAERETSLTVDDLNGGTHKRIGEFMDTIKKGAPTAKCLLGIVKENRRLVAKIRLYHRLMGA